MRSVRFGRPCRLSGCGASSFRSSLVSSLSFPRSGSPCLPVASVLPCVVLAPPRRHAVGGEVVGSSLLAPLVRYGGRGVGRCLVLAAWGGPFSCPHDVVSSRVRYRRWACCLLFAPPLLARLSFRLSRLLTTFPIVRISRAVPVCIGFRPRHFAPGNRSRPAPRVEQDGEQDGEGLYPRARFAPRECECLRR